MIAGSFHEITAEAWTTLPDAFHYVGAPTAWTRVTRPGLAIHSFLEGPCWDAAGNLWLADVPHGRLFTVAPDGSWSLALSYDGEPHGLAIADDGTLLIADYRRGLLAHRPGDAGVTTLCDRVNSEPFRGLADVAIAPGGDIWLTDPGRSSLSDPTGRLFCLRGATAIPELVLANLPYPNSVAISPDGRQVYVSVTRANAVWRLLADAPDPGWPMVGAFLHLSGGLGPDGLAVGSDGRLALAQAQAGRAWVFDALGDPIARIRVPRGRWTTAVRFDPAGTTLIVVEAETGSIYRAALDPLQE